MNNISHDLNHSKLNNSKNAGNQLQSLHLANNQVRLPDSKNNYVVGDNDITYLLGKKFDDQS